MTSKTLMSVEEYLQTSFEDGDRDYIDGEVEERNVGERGHSFIQVRLVAHFLALAEGVGIEVLTEIRVQIDDGRYRVADVGVWPAGVLGWGIPEVPPLLAIEILSPKDRMSRILTRVGDYLRAGVRTVWVIDPQNREAVCITPENPMGQVVEVLRVENPAIAIPLSAVLPASS